MIIPYRDQKVDARQEEHPTSKAQKSQKVISTTHVNTENKPKSLHYYTCKLPNDVIWEYNEQYS